MKKKIIIAGIFTVALIGALSAEAATLDLKGLLGKIGEGISNSNQNNDESSKGGIITNMLEGVFSKSNLEVKDLAGTYTIQGSAVNFRSENFLQQAGGVAAAGVIENKLDPYFKKVGLTGGTITIADDGTFTLQMKKGKLTGTLEKQADAGKKGNAGNFILKFNVFGINMLGSFDTYITKNYNGMDIMFDASKLKALLKAVSSFTRIKLASAVVNVLDSYEGICVGFSAKK